MTFLPIVERELRVAARKRSTFWVRIAAAIVALIIGGGFLLLATVWNAGYGPASFGRGLFATLTWMSLAAALAAGLFFTSDCLSEEKREGTIGFLFLTDLKGYDVVLGKLLATSLRGFYALLALFPILAVTLLMGGVTGAQFWKTALALVNALFFSLAAGMFISAISRESQKALGGTLILLLLFVAGGPALDAILDALVKGSSRAFSPFFSLSSPGYLFVTAGAWGRTPFWPALLISQACAWVLLVVSSVLLPRTWHDKTASTSSGPGSWAHSWKFGGAKRRKVLRRKLLDVNPVLWLACRESWQRWLVWGMSLLLAGGTVTLAIFPDWHQSMGWFVASYVGSALMLALYLGMASQAGRFFVEAQRSGLLELLLATPLSGIQIVQGQWSALLRMFGIPLALYLAAQLVGTVMFQQITWSRMAAATPPPPLAVSATNMTGTATTSTTIVTTTRVTTMSPTVTVAVASAVGAQPWFVTWAVSAAGTVAMAGNLAALSWFGMWMGLNSKNNSLATLKTIAFVQIIPWFLVSFLSAMCLGLLMFSGLASGIISSGPRMMICYPLITSGFTTMLALAKDIGFLVWSRRKLYSDFRERVARVVSPIRSPSTSPPPPPPAASRAVRA